MSQKKRPQLDKQKDGGKDGKKKKISKEKE